MRTTLRIDDDLLRALKQQAHHEGISITTLVNRALRQGIAQRRRAPSGARFRERVFAMGTPSVSLQKALSLAASLEDEEVARKTALRK